MTKIEIFNNIQNINNNMSHFKNASTFFKGTLSLSLDTPISGNKLVIVIKQLGKALCPGAMQDTFIKLLNEIKESLVYKR